MLSVPEGGYSIVLCACKRRQPLLLLNLDVLGDISVPTF